MHIKVGLENNLNGSSCAWVQDHPGVTASGKDGSEALLRVPQALVAFQGWIAKHSDDSWLADLGDFDVRMVELLDHSVEKNESRNWFEDDKRALEPLELQRGLLVLAWQRADLLEMAGSFTPADLERTFEGESDSMSGILQRIAEDEQRDLSSLGLPITELTVGEDVFSRLAAVREQLTARLSAWPHDDPVLERDGNLWSARKLLRRAIRHERESINDFVTLINYF